MNLKLNANDKVALVCPGSICTDPNHPKQTQLYLKEHYQLNAIYSEDINQGLSPQRRAQNILDVLFDDSIKLIAALRGGEGTADTLAFVHEYHDKIKLLKPKMLLGYSDFTALLVYFEKFYQWPVIHGPSVRQIALNTIDERSRHLLMDFLFGKSQELTLTDLTPLNERARENKVIEGQMTGGNLSVLNVSIKDIWEIETENKILFLEDCGEKAHKTLRLLKYFSRIGKFSNVKAVILGDFTCWPVGCSKTEQEHNRQAILKSLSSFALHHDFPVLHTTQFGHGVTNIPLLYCQAYQLQLGCSAKLRLLNET